MTTREYLSQIRRFDKMISNKREEIYNLRAMVYGTSVPMGGDRVQSSGDKDKLGSFMSKIVDTEREMEELVSRRWEIVQEIESLDDTDEYNVLAKKYVLQKDIKEIAVEENETPRHTYRLISRAIESFENRYGAKYLGGAQNVR